MHEKSIFRGLYSFEEMTRGISPDSYARECNAPESQSPSQPVPESDLLVVLQDFSKSDNRLNEKALNYLILVERVSTIGLDILIPETADIIKHVS